MNVSSSIYQAQAAWRQALVDAKRAARHVSQMQSDADERLVQERAERLDERQRQRYFANWHLGDPGYVGRFIDESG